MRTKYKSLLLLSLLGSSLALNTTSEASVLEDNYPNQWKSGYGNAISWGSVARNQGYRVDMNPAFGSVAWFSAVVNAAASIKAKCLATSTSRT